MVPELLDFAEQAVHVAGIFAEQAALEHQRILGRGQVTHFAPTANALIGVDADNAKVPMIPPYRSNAHVGDFEITGA